MLCLGGYARQLSLVSQKVLFLCSLSRTSQYYRELHEDHRPDGDKVHSVLFFASDSHRGSKLWNKHLRTSIVCRLLTPCYSSIPTTYDIRSSNSVLWFYSCILNQTCSVDSGNPGTTWLGCSGSLSNVLFTTGSDHTDCGTTSSDSSNCW